MRNLFTADAMHTGRHRAGLSAGVAPYLAPDSSIPSTAPAKDSALGRGQPRNLHVAISLVRNVGRMGARGTASVLWCRASWPPARPIARGRRRQFGATAPVSRLPRGPRTAPSAFAAGSIPRTRSTEGARSSFRARYGRSRGGRVRPLARSSIGSPRSPGRYELGPRGPRRSRSRSMNCSCRRLFARSRAASA